ncbi:unnamed protein product [Caenorhabditis auriculariae]|uniref:Letm1 RBD domain-containing protein n=1 Tax=Caenorhabditis auriculariae TaxID=2777116 RepID=A0A8S1GW85_9PELO|nr:unnamed protein product [Caenorhabditis auriculariae]
MSRMAYRRAAEIGRVRLLHPELASSHLLHTSLRYASVDKSKIDYTLKMLKEDIQKQQEEVRKLKVAEDKQIATVKPTLKEKIVHELKHYYHGFRLLALETKLSAKYLWRILRGATLSRRERQQLVRTVSDLFRLVPFSIFVIVPFMELALPIFIKLFPNMLPSTFQETSKEEEKLRKQVKLRVEMAKFLQDTIEEIGLERKTRSEADSKSLEFAQFIKKVREEGGYVSIEELLKFSKLFEDQLTLDNLNMGQLRSLCRLMGLQSFGSPEILRFQLNMKIRELKADDKQIAAEGGVEKLSSLDLQKSCRDRGMRAIGLSEERLREQLSQWLELSLNDEVPPSLLLLSRTLFLPEDVSFTDRLKSIMQSLPDSVSETTRQKLLEMEGGTVDHAARIALVKHIEDGIAAEREAAEKRKAEEKQKEVLAAAAKTAEVKAEAAKAADFGEIPLTESAENIQQRVPEASASIAQAAADAHEAMQSVKEELATAIDGLKTMAKAEKNIDIKVDPKDLSSIEQIIVGGPLHEAKKDIVGLKEKVIEHSEDLIEIHALDGAFAETKVAKRLRNKLNSMIEDVDTLVSKLEDEKRSISESLTDPAAGGSDNKKEREVRIQDVIDSLSLLKESSASEESESKTKRIETLLKAIDDDADGIIDRVLVLEVIELLENHTDVYVSPSQMVSLIGTLKKEGEVAHLTQHLHKAEIGDIDVPVLPSGPSSAGAFEQPSDQAPELKENDKNASLDIPHVDPTITTPLRQKQQNGTKAEPPL